MTRTVRARLWGPRLAILAALLCFGAVAAALIAALGAGQGAWHFRVGFAVMRYAFYVAAGGAVLALIAAFIARPAGGRAVVLSLLSFAVAAIFLLYVGNQVRTARSVPPIHDIATDLDTLPEFRRLSLREDYLEKVPDLDRPDLAALPPLERWKAIHREHYADIQPVVVPWSVSETVTRAEALARRRGWAIADFAPDAGRLEATETSRFFRFKDDIVLIARPAPEGGTRVDMRSISRVGGSDVGVNAHRIRTFLADLQAG